MSCLLGMFWVFVAPGLTCFGSLLGRVTLLWDPARKLGSRASRTVWNSCRDFFLSSGSLEFCTDLNELCMHCLETRFCCWTCPACLVIIIIIIKPPLSNSDSQWV